MQTVKLKIRKGDAVETQAHEIDSINLLQFQKALKIVNDIIKKLDGEGALADLIETTFNDEEATDRDFLSAFANSFEFLLIEMPEQAYDLLAVLADVKPDVLMSQKIETAFELFDAVLEENDIERIINRAKKSSAVIKAKTRFLNKSKQATATAPLQ